MCCHPGQPARDQRPPPSGRGRSADLTAAGPRRGTVIDLQRPGHTLCADRPQTAMRVARSGLPSILAEYTMSRLPARLLCTLAFACPAVLAAEPPDADALAQGLIRLRAEVEQLNGDLNLLRDEQRTTLGGLNAQKAELSANIERQTLASRELRGKLDERAQASTQAALADDGLKPLLLETLAGLRTHIARGLPYKRDERLADIDAFRAAIESGSTPPARALNRLWALFEDEFRLSRENTLNTQTIDLDGEKVLAEVAKVGSIALYFRTQDGRVGQAQPGADGWHFALARDKGDVARIDALYDALKKQIRQGWFELPVALAGGVR